MEKEIGKHFIVDYKGCDPQTISFVPDVEEVFIEAAKLSGATILKSHFYQFQPAGITGIILIAESHFALHTYPENGYVAFDVYTCGTMDPQITIEKLKTAFKAQFVDIQVLTRGI